MTFSAHKSEIEALLTNGQTDAAWARLVSILDAETSPQANAFVIKQAHQFDFASLGLVRVRVALIGSFTLDLFAPVLQARAYASRLAAELYVGGFNAWQSELLNPASALYSFQPDVIFLAVRLEELAPRLLKEFASLDAAEINAEIERALDSLRGALRALRAKSNARVVIHNFAAPPFPILGILDANRADGQQAAVARLNAELAEVARQVQDVWILDAARLQSEIGYQQWHDARLWALAKLPLSGKAQQRLAAEYVRFLRAFYGLSRKVLVLDLDNVLWGGVLGEEGGDGIQLGAEYPGSAYVEFQRAVLDLYHRGVLLALNSKNNAEEAMNVIENHPAMRLRPNHFAATRINWLDKAENLSSLAAELNLGLESFVFADDSEIEIARVRSALPQVLALQVQGEPGLRADWLRSLDVFDSLSFSAEDRTRGALYAQERERTHLKQSIASLPDFYRSLEMELLLFPADERTLERAAQLTQRTNQFNLTTRRYTAAQLRTLQGTPGTHLILAQLRDRFGDNGIIGLALTRSDAFTTTLDTFLLSCRVIGRGIESALLAYVMELARELGHYRFGAEFIPTAKNHVAENFLAEQGLAHTADGTWQKELQNFRAAYPDWLAVRVNGLERA